MKVCVYGAHGKVGTVLSSELTKMGVDLYKPQRDIVGNADVYFLCTHREVSSYLIPNLPKNAIVIDFSGAYRKESMNGGEWSYGQISNPDLKLTNRISVAGCIASSIELALMPLSIEQDIFITSFIGQSAKGRFSPKSTEQCRVFTHPHHYEINKFFNTSDLSFVPIIGEHESGIMSVCQLNLDHDPMDSYRGFYKNDKSIIVSDKPHKISDVVGTENTIISIENNAGKYSITCSLDNLYRGSATHGVRLLQEFLK